jgi:hypothetical protein
MPVTILFASRVLEIEDTEDLTIWEELFDMLYDFDVIDENEYREGLNSGKLSEEISIVLDLKNSNEVGVKPNKTGPQSITFKKADKQPLAEIQRESEPNTSRKPITFGKKQTIVEPPSVIQKSSVTPPTSRSNIPKIIVRNTGELYRMSLICSKSGIKWISTITSSQKPLNFVRQNDAVKSQFVIHLLLDDSSSMYKKNAHTHLISAVSNFLEQRTSNEEFKIHSINNGLFNKVATNPVGAKKILAKYKPGGWTHMCNAFSNLKVGKGDILIFFSDGGSTDGDPSSIASKLKIKSNLRIISIVQMEGLASKSSDYHHASKPSNLLEIFSNVSKSLVQRQTVAEVSTKSKKDISIAKQISSSLFDASEPESTSVQKLGSNQGFSVIENFECHSCSTMKRVVCGSCGDNLCGGGIKNSELECPTCKVSCQIEISDSAIGRVGGVAGKKKS